MTKAYPFAPQRFHMPADPTPAQAHPSAEQLQAEEAAYRAKPMLIITGPKRTSALRRLRRLRFYVREVSLIVVNIAAAVAATGIAYTVWLLISAVLSKSGGTAI